MLQLKRCFSSRLKIFFLVSLAFFTQKIFAEELPSDFLVLTYSSTYKQTVDARGGYKIRISKELLAKIEKKDSIMCALSLKDSAFHLVLMNAMPNKAFVVLINKQEFESKITTKSYQILDSLNTTSVGINTSCCEDEPETSVSEDAFNLHNAAILGFTPELLAMLPELPIAEGTAKLNPADLPENKLMCTWFKE
jgi:hypothetical protein